MLTVMAKLKQREIFGIKIHGTLIPHSLNQELI